jgi:Holliday junction resolvasome RuvABC ATP-dependent DNA helicase subunit
MRKLESFHGFFGQRKAVRFLTGQLKGAQAHGEPCPHLLFIGPSGMGKTRLARALAEEAGTALHPVHGRAKPADLVGQLARLKDADFVFLDEAHRLGREAQTLMLGVIDDFRAPDLLDPTAEAQRDQDGRLVIAPLTVVLATDQPGQLLEALHRRMEHVVHLADYARAELVEIAAASASELGLLITPQGLGVLADASQGQPRRALQLLKGLRREHSGDRQPEITKQDVRTYLDAADIGRLGITPEQRAYLVRLRKLGSASLATLAALVGADEDYVAGRLEPGLVKLDFIRKGRYGRKLTPAGMAWVRELTGKVPVPQAPEVEGSTHEDV